LSSNILKGGFVQLNTDNTRVIDVNDLVKKRIEESESGLLRERTDEVPEEQERVPLTDEEGNPVFDEDGNPVFLEPEIPEDNISELTKDSDAPIVLDPAEVRAECDEMIKDAEAKAEKIKEDARDYVKESAEKAREDGYEEGKALAYQELESERAALNEERAAMQLEFENKLKEIEPKMVDVITDIYSRVFGENFFSRRDVMVALLNRALLSIDTEEQIVINISPADYDLLMGMKASILEKISLNLEPEIRQKEDLLPGQAKIETPYGIIDCSIDTELRELTRTLKILSREGQNDS
jgi:flagellar assembly protein FliH